MSVGKLLAAALALCPALIAAQQGWAREPKSFLGVELGLPISAVPVCPPVERADIGLCVTAPIEGRPDRLRLLRGLPSLGVRIRSAAIGLVEGRVSVVMLDVPHVDWPRLRAMLVERYGDPHQAKSVNLQTTLGASVTSENLAWAGDAVILVAAERHRRADEANVSIALRRLVAEGLRDGESALKDDAKKF